MRSASSSRAQDGEFVAYVHTGSFLIPLLVKDARHFENAHLAILAHLQEAEGLPKAHFVGTQGTHLIFETCIGVLFAIEACELETVNIDVSLAGTHGDFRDAFVVTAGIRAGSQFLVLQDWLSEEVNGAALDYTVEHAEDAGTHLKFLGNGVLLVAFDTAPTGDLARRRCLGPAFDVCGACDEWGALVAARAGAPFLATLPLIQRVCGGNGSKENIAVLMLKRRLLRQNMVSVHDAAAACGIGSPRAAELIRELVSSGLDIVPQNDPDGVSPEVGPWMAARRQWTREVFASQPSELSEWFVRLVALNRVVDGLRSSDGDFLAAFGSFRDADDVADALVACGQAAIAERIITGRSGVKAIGERLRGAGGRFGQADLSQCLIRLQAMGLIQGI
jgi:hypothetical protein